MFSVISQFHWSRETFFLLQSFTNAVTEDRLTTEMLLDTLLTASLQEKKPTLFYYDVMKRDHQTNIQSKIIMQTSL